MTSLHNPFSNRHEGVMTFIWGVTLIALLTYVSGDYYSKGISLLISISFFGYHLLRWSDQVGIQSNFANKSKETISINQLQRIVSEKNTLFCGQAFEWSDKERQLYKLAHKELGNKIKEGALLHGLGHEKSFLLPEKFNNNHILIAGTTGAGKTRFIELLLAQKALSKPEEAIIILDPKGDHDLCERVHRLAGDRFIKVDMLDAEHSIALNLVSDYVISSEVSTRICALLPQSESAQSFTSVSWRAIDAVVKGFEVIGKKPTLKEILIALTTGKDQLAEQAVWQTIRATVPNEADKLASTCQGKVGPMKVLNLFHEYQKLVGLEKVDDRLQKLMTIYSLDSVYLDKMTAALFPILNRLTEAPLNTLLSPDDSYRGERYNMKQVIQKAKVLYINLNCLLDQQVGQAVGALCLASLASAAGSLQNHQDTDARINVFIDEASMLSNDVLINLLNKGRSCGFQLVVATQTFSDFEAATGTKAKASEILANTNIKVFLRCLDADTQRFATEALPKTEVIDVTTSHSNRVASDQDSINSISSTAFHNQEVSLVEAAMLGRLPDMHYFMCLPDRVMKGRIPFIENTDNGDN